VKKSPAKQEQDREAGESRVGSWGLTPLLVAALGGVEGDDVAADGVGGRAGAGNARVLRGVGDVQDAAVVGAEPRGAGVPAGPAVGDVVPSLGRAVEGEGAAAIGQRPAEDLDAGIGHRLWREGGDKGLCLGKEVNVTLAPAWEILLASPKSPGDGEEPVWPRTLCKQH